MNGKAKILLVDSCYEAYSLSQYEFVRPVQRILERTGFPCQVCHISLLNEERLKSCDKVVLCGTAFKDSEYLNHLERYTWLKEGDRPVLGQRKPTVCLSDDGSRIKRSDRFREIVFTQETNQRDRAQGC